MTTATPTKPRKKAKTMEEKIADLRQKEAWKLIRKAEKIEAKATLLRKQAADLIEGD